MDFYYPENMEITSELSLGQREKSETFQNKRYYVSACCNFFLKLFGYVLIFFQLSWKIKRPAEMFRIVDLPLS
jgi:hypothetical protein